MENRGGRRWVSELASHPRAGFVPTSISLASSLQDPGTAAPRIYSKQADLSEAKGDCRGYRLARYRAVGGGHLSVESFSRNCLGWKRATFLKTTHPNQRQLHLISLISS